MALLVSSLAPSDPIRKLRSVCSQRQPECRKKPTRAAAVAAIRCKKQQLIPNLCAMRSESGNMCHDQWKDKPETVRCIKGGIKAMNLQVEEKFWPYSGTKAQMNTKRTGLYQLNSMSQNPGTQDDGIRKTPNWSLK